LGVAIGDFDNDGLPDIYVTGYGHNVLYHNLGGCKMALYFIRIALMNGDGKYSFRSYFWQMHDHIKGA
jgi:hypothetical protein